MRTVCVGRRLTCGDKSPWMGELLFEGSSEVVAMWLGPEFLEMPLSRGLTKHNNG